MAAIGLAPASVAFAQSTVGSEKCKACHQKSYEAWSRSKHARAHVVLPAKRRADAQCLKCHSPAEAESGGVNVGVGCEGCHGAGEWYSARFIMLDKELARDLGLEPVGEGTCRKCHTADSPRGARFKYGEWLRRIAHPDKK